MLDHFHLTPEEARVICTACLAVIASLSLIVSICTLCLQRQHNKLSVRLLLSIVFQDYEGCLSVKLQNNGIGPLTISSVEVSDGVRTETCLIDWVSPRLDEGIEWETFVGDIEGRHIRPNASMTLLQLSGDDSCDSFLKTRDACRQVLKQLTVSVVYANVYKERMPRESRQLLWFGRNLASS